jgi:hypothetical protein
MSSSSREKISNSLKGDKNPNFGKKLSSEARKKRSLAMLGKRTGSLSFLWKGGVTKNKISLYDTYSNKLSWCEETRRDPNNNDILQVRCSYCGKWYMPSRDAIGGRVRSIKINSTWKGENKFYCSNECKFLCPIYRRKIKYKFQEGDYTRELQPELRRMVFERDNWTCIKCGNTKYLHCHHLEGIRWEPIESADMDKCITVCKDCHEEIHKKDDCGKSDMRCK